jgi:hypothetical protein
MKTLSIILICVMMVSCYVPSGKTVTNKYYTVKDLPKCICEFRYADGGRTFEDSCFYYIVGDTIGRPRINSQLLDNQNNSKIKEQRIKDREKLSKMGL